MNAIIIDDMESARCALRADIEDYCPAVTVIGEAEGVVSGFKLLKSHEVDIVFLDIQMNDGSGFDLLEILPEINFKVIFTTASDAYAIKAFKFSAIDYLLKPIDPDDLQAAVGKIQDQSLHEKDQLSLLYENLDQNNRLERLALHTQDRIKVVQLADIIRCEAEVNYTHFHFTDGEKLLVSKSLKEYDGLLSDYQFLRVHQSHLVNMKQISEFVKTDGGYLKMLNGDSVPVSTRKRAGVVEALEKM